MSEAPAPKEPLPIVTIVLVAVNLAAFAFEVSSGADLMNPTSQVLLDMGGNFGPATFNGESWRLLSSMFLHAGLIHLAVNMFSLFMVGRAIERLYGKPGYIAIYLFAGIVGGIASSVWPNRPVSVGASGAIFGIFAAVGAYLLVNRDKLDKDVLKSEATSLLTTLALNVVAGFQMAGIDMRAHAGGFIAGFLASLLLASGKQRGPRVIAIFAVAAIAFGSAHVIPPPANSITDFGTLESKALDRFNSLMSAKAENEEAATVIEREILPTWREAKQVAADLDLPTEIQANFRAYVDKREAAFVAMIAALRKNDQAGFADAMNVMAEAEALLNKLRAPQ